MLSSMAMPEIYLVNTDYRKLNKFPFSDYVYLYIDIYFISFIVRSAVTLGAKVGIREMLGVLSLSEH
jgi:hypothetical protein